MPHVRRKGTLVENPAENAQDTATDDLLLVDSPEDDDPLLEEPAPARQGLPPGFRMRHDRHYVDELMGMRAASPSRPVKRVAEPLTPAAAPSRDTSADATRALRAAIAALAERLDVVREHAGAGRRSGAPTSFDRALQVELDRASRLAHTAVALGGDLQIARRDVTGGEIAERTRTTIAALRRFSGVRFDVSADDPAFRIAVDSGAVTQAIAATLHAFSDLVDGSSDSDYVPVVQVRIHSAQPRPALMVEISAAGVTATDDAVAEFFEASTGCHPAGIEGAVLLNGAARIARAHGGRADARRGSDGELIALLVFPKSQRQL